MQSIKAEPLGSCPECGNSVVRLVSLPAAFLDKNRQANQYSEVKYAKYWRDKDGNRHKVTPADGERSSPTVSSRRKRSDEQVAAIKKEVAQKRKQKRRAESYRRFVQKQMNAKKKRG